MHKQESYVQQELQLQYMPAASCHKHDRASASLSRSYCYLLKVYLAVNKTVRTITWKMITTKNINKETPKEMLPMMIPSLLKRWASLDAFLASSYLPSPLCRLTYNRKENKRDAQRVFKCKNIYCNE